MKKISAAKRFLLLQQSKGRCMYCGVVLTEGNFSIDHVVAAASGGQNTIDNLRACCRSCNAKKGPRGIEEFRLQVSIDKTQFAGKITASKLIELQGLGADFGIIPKTIFYFEGML